MVVTRCGFARTDYYGDPFSNPDVRVLGTISNESFAGRIPVYLSSLPVLRRLLTQASVVVVFSAELALLARAATLFSRRRRPWMIRELADVPRAVDGPGRTAAVARVIERLGATACDGFLVTSPRFVDDYVRPTLRFRGPAAVVENKPDLPIRLQPRERRRSDKVTVGYFGLLRCPTTIALLRRLAAHPSRRFEVIVYGYVMPNSEAVQHSESDTFRFAGEYVSPDDLAKIYGECDVVYSGYPYDPGRLNARLATTNRYAEAIHFGLPQIAHTGTEDGRRVTELGVGLAIDPSAVDNAVMELLAVTDVQWAAMAKRAVDVRATLSPFQEDLEAALDVVLPAGAR